MNPSATASRNRRRDLPLARSLACEGDGGDGAEALLWLSSLNTAHTVYVERTPLDRLSDWQFLPSPLRLAHRSGRFFCIQGIHTETDYGPVCAWDQPIINQPEIGILGILTKVFGKTRYFLMQAKPEPGNINGVQLAPTVQATLSNYTRVHGGRTPKYVEYFTGGQGRVLVDQLQSEQGSRFLCKRNRNMIVEPDGDVPFTDEFRWMTLHQIKCLLRRDNVVNMDSRSVISCIPLPSKEQFRPDALTDFGMGVLCSACGAAKPRHTIADILAWLHRMRTAYRYRLRARGLDELESWTLRNTELSHCEGRYFSVVGVRVEMNNREVARWTQPLLYHNGRGLNGMVTQVLGGVLHFLIRACFYPGNMEMFELGSTVSRSDYLNQVGRPDAPPFLELFRPGNSAQVRCCSVQSEEGGRFLHYQNQYMIVELPPDSIGEEPEGFIWMTMAQIQELLARGYFNIEARNLVACIDVCR